MTDASRPDSPLFAYPWSGLTGWNSMISTAGDYAQTCVQACAGWQQEVTRFSALRAAENQRALSALVSSRDLGDVLKVQQQWGLQAATDYAQEATRLAQIAVSLSLTGTTPDVQDAASIIA